MTAGRRGLYTLLKLLQALVTGWSPRAIVCGMSGKALVLLVEDAPADVTVVREALSMLGNPVDLMVVTDGNAALDYLFKQPPYEGVPRPDLIMLDLNLPLVSGRQVLAAVKVNPHLARIPVVIYSSAWTPELIADCKRLAEDYVVKPKTWAECVDRLRLVLRNIPQESRVGTLRDL